MMVILLLMPFVFVVTTAALSSDAVVYCLNGNKILQYYDVNGIADYLKKVSGNIVHLEIDTMRDLFMRVKSEKQVLNSILNRKGDFSTAIPRRRHA
jgi:hypothetical protein